MSDMIMWITECATAERIATNSRNLALLARGGLSALWDATSTRSDAAEPQ
jgi:hypothetical protein